MKVHLVIAAAAVALSSSVALAGGYKGNKHIGAPQFANAVALNYSKQIVTSKTLFSKGKIDQTAGATAKAVNESKCGCKGVQLSNAFAKNNSLQVATVVAGAHIGGISQTAVASATAKNIRK